MMISICIPTYNRGKRALPLVENLLSRYKDRTEEIEIIVSDNGSDLTIDEYEQIKELSKEYEILTYHRFSSNQFYVGNYNYLIKASKGDFCLMISDEDNINPQEFEYYMEYLQSNPSVGLVRPATMAAYQFTESELYKAGNRAVKENCWKNNYISGAIYNRHILTDDIIDSFESMWGGKTDGETYENEAYFYYPHLFVEIFLCTRSDYYKCAHRLIEEGKPEEDVKRSEETNILCFSTFESRMEQYRGFMEYVKELGCSDGEKLQMTVLLIDRIIFWLSFVKPMYQKSGESADDMTEKLKNEMRRITFRAEIPIIREHWSDIAEYIDACIDCNF